MPPINRASVHTDSPLTNFVVQYGDKAELAGMVMEVVTDNESDEFYRMEQNARRVSNIKRGDAVASAFVELGLEKDTFSIDEYAMHTVFGARLLRAQHPALKLLQRASVALESLIELEYDAQVFSLLTTDANFATTHTATIAAGSEWDDYTDGDPLGNVDADVDRLLTSVGSLPTGARLMGACPVGVWNALKHHPDVVERVKYSSAPGTPVETGIVAGLMGLSDILVPRRPLNAAAETPDSLSNPKNNTRLWPDTTDQFVIAVVAGSVGNAPPNTASLSAYGSFGTHGLAVRRWSNNEELASQDGPAEYLEPSKYWDLKILCVDTLASGKSIASTQRKNCLA